MMTNTIQVQCWQSVIPYPTLLTKHMQDFPTLHDEAIFFRAQKKCSDGNFISDQDNTNGGFVEGDHDGYGQLGYQAQGGAAGVQCSGRRRQGPDPAGLSVLAGTQESHNAGLPPSPGGCDSGTSSAGGEGAEGRRS